MVVRLYPVVRRHADAPVGHYPQDVRRVWVVPYNRLERPLEVIMKSVTASVPVPEVHRDVLVAVLVYGWMPAIGISPDLPAVYRGMLMYFSASLRTPGVKK